MMYKDTQGCRLTLGYKAPQYVYGEMEKIEGYYSLFSHSKNLQNKAVFCDLGSGLGKPVLLVASMFNTRECIGIEYVPKLHHVALAQKYIYEKLIAPKVKNPPLVSFLCDDVLRCTKEWEHSDVVFINCVT